MLKPEPVQRLLVLALLSFLTLAAARPAHATGGSEARAAAHTAHQQMEKNRGQLKADRTALDQARQHGNKAEIDLANRRVRASLTAYNHSQTALRDKQDALKRLEKPERDAAKAHGDAARAAQAQTRAAHAKARAERHTAAEQAQRKHEKTAAKPLLTPPSAPTAAPTTPQNP